VENGLQYTAIQHSLMGMMFALALGAHIVGAVWFVHSRASIAPRYRAAPTISLMVMLASGLLFARLALSWQGAFDWNADLERWVQSDALFDNTLRYINWMVTIPLLACQFLIVIDLPRTAVMRNRVLLVASGVAMVLAGMIGQFYETSSTSALLVWGAISTVPFVPLLLIVLKELERGRGQRGPEAARTLRNIQLLFLFAWGLYPLAYLVPAFADTASWAITRQGMFTTADILSKVVYGVLLTKVARIRSAEDGWPAAVELEDVRTDGTGDGRVQVSEAAKT
jgi:bacteriorhodopsin